MRSAQSLHDVRVRSWLLSELCLCAKTPSAKIPYSMAFGISAEINSKSGGGREGSGAQCESNHVKTIFFWTFARNDTDEEMCYVSLHIGVGLRKILGLSNMYICIWGYFTDLNL